MHTIFPPHNLSNGHSFTSNIFLPICFKGALVFTCTAIPFSSLLSLPLSSFSFLFGLFFLFMAEMLHSSPAFLFEKFPHLFCFCDLLAIASQMERIFSCSLSLRLVFLSANIKKNRRIKNTLKPTVIFLCVWICFHFCIGMVELDYKYL